MKPPRAKTPAVQTAATTPRAHAGVCGNVRDALLQAETFAVLGDHVSRPDKPQLKVICSAKSEQAKRAWQTIRANQAA